MATTASMHQQARQPQTNLRRDGWGEAVFKPLALPALAAAVQMSRRDDRRPATERQVPSILRVEALVD
ncbi:MAG TPA: hypothetical protein VHL98_07995 [Microvirga sp.]|jgi:hypothetical protein|nr:hypothetical protein [Microvirga sp.]